MARCSAGRSGGSRAVYALFVFLLIFPFAVLFSPNAHATEVQPLSFEDLGRRAQQVVQGRVSQVQSYWNAAHTKILTEVSIDVDRRYKGDGPSRVRVVEMGGVVGNVKMTVAGAVPWRTDQEVLLFLEPSLPNRYRVAGFTQGRFAVQRDAATGEMLVRGASLGGIVAGVGPAARSGAAARLRLQALLDRALGPQVGRQDGGR